MRASKAYAKAAARPTPVSRAAAKPFVPNAAQRRLLDIIHSRPLHFHMVDLCNYAGVPRRTYYSWCQNPNFRLWLTTAWSARLLLDGTVLLNVARANSTTKYFYWKALFDLTFDPKGLGDLQKWQRAVASADSSLFDPGPGNDVQSYPPVRPSPPKPDPNENPAVFVRKQSKDTMLANTPVPSNRLKTSGPLEPDRQDSAIQHLAMAVFMGNWPHSIMSMFTAYFDASGSPDETQVFVVAGFVATAKRWVELETEWKKCLSDFDVSSLHMKEFAHSVGEFKLWKGDTERRRAFLLRLISIIKLHVKNGFASAVLMNDFRAVDAKYCLSDFTAPYPLAGGTVVYKLNKWARRWNIPSGHMLIAFEDGDQEKGRLREDVKRYFGMEPVFLPKARSVAFQCADLLAYENFKANQKLLDSEAVCEDDLRGSFLELSRIPGCRDSDTGVHQERDMVESCLAMKIPLRGGHIAIR